MTTNDDKEDDNSQLFEPSASDVKHVNTAIVIPDSSPQTINHCIHPQAAEYDGGKFSYPLYAFNKKMPVRAANVDKSRRARMDRPRKIDSTRIKKTIFCDTVGHFRSMKSLSRSARKLLHLQKRSIGNRAEGTVIRKNNKNSGGFRKGGQGLISPLAVGGDKQCKNEEPLHKKSKGSG